MRKATFCLLGSLFLFATQGVVVFVNAAVPVTSLQPSVADGNGTEGLQGTIQQRSTSQPSADWVGSLLNKLNTLLQQVQSMQGRLDEQEHQLDKLKAQIKRQYTDMDRRLSQLTTGLPDMSGVSKPNTGKKAHELPSTDEAQIKPVTDSEAYQQAFSLIGQKKFDLAIAAFSNFVNDYPESSLVANSWYWLGEIYSATGKADKAQQSFSQVVNTYPKSNKVADAMYKLGQLSAVAGNKSEAIKYLKQVIAKYPKSSAAQLSKNYLKSIY